MSALWLSKRRRLRAAVLVGLAGISLAQLGGCQSSPPPIHNPWDADAPPPEQPAEPAQLEPAAMPIEHAVRRLPPPEPTAGMRRSTGIHLASHDESVDKVSPHVLLPLDLMQVPEHYHHEIDDEGETVAPSGSTDETMMVLEQIEPPPEPDEEVAPVPETDVAEANGQAYPIDLANALALGGASNLQIELARERVIEAQALYLQAKATWLPTLRAGVGYNVHNGRIQATEGEIIEVSRKSLFVGGGAGLDGAPVNGGAGGPPRLFANLALADVFFEPLVAGRVLDAADAGAAATNNTALLHIAVAYFQLVEAHGLLANAETGLDAADKMLELATLFAKAGKLSEAEVDRATAEMAFWMQAAEDARRVTTVRSAELARQLRLDPYLTLLPVEVQVTPVELVDDGLPREALISQGLNNRPELAERGALVAAAVGRSRQEHWRPWLPTVQAGASGGNFGGGTGDDFDNFSGRSDVDLLAVWEARHMGLGNHGLLRERASQLRQAQIEADQVRDQIAAEIVAAAADVASYRNQYEIARAGVLAAEESYRRNFQRVRDLEGLPIELLQAIRAWGAALDAHTRAVSRYNQAQYRLLRAVGEPPDA